MNSDWANMIVGSLSYYEQVDSTVPHVRSNSETALLQEISLASHLNIPAVTFKLTQGLSEKSNLARIIYSKITTASTLQFWVQVLMTNPGKQSMTYRSNEEHEVECPWEWWNDFRSFCDFDKKLGVSLIVSKDLPDEKEVSSLKFIVIFNRTGYVSCKFIRSFVSCRSKGGLVNRFGHLYCLPTYF